MRQHIVINSSYWHFYAAKTLKIKTNGLCTVKVTENGNNFSTASWFFLAWARSSFTVEQTRNLRINYLVDMHSSLICNGYCTSCWVSTAGHSKVAGWFVVQENLIAACHPDLISGCSLTASWKLNVSSKGKWFPSLGDWAFATFVKGRNQRAILK